MDDDQPRAFGGLQGVVLAVLALLLVVMLGQTVYLLSYGQRLRESQNALVCQWQVTQSLREAAGRERAAQRALLSANASSNSNTSGMSEADRRTAQRLAITAYLDVLADNDADRAALPLCPDPRGS
jgi:type II secretory pathway pseudopilin PulG